MITIDSLLERIIEYNDLPKFQVERALSPILSFYIDNVVALLVKSDSVKMIMPEFPLKEENNQSTNIDYLVIDESKSEIILVELKTNYRANISSVFEHQKKYELVVEKIRNEGASFLKEDVSEILKKSDQKEKYKYLLKYTDKIDSGIRNGRILYIVPEIIKTNPNIKKNLKYTSIFSFSDFPLEINSDENYKKVRKALLRLNGIV